MKSGLRNLKSLESPLNSQHWAVSSKKTISGVMRMELKTAVLASLFGQMLRV
jgi:hypothetical protein